MQQTRGILAALATSVLWGLSFLSTRYLVPDIGPVTLAVMRFVIACIVLAVPAILEIRRHGWQIRSMVLVVLTGFCGVTMYFLCENKALVYLSASESSLIVASIPVVSVLMESVSSRKIAARTVIGAVLSFGGVALVVIRSLQFSGSALGYLLMAGACLSWLLYTFYSKNLAKKDGKISLTFFQNLFGLVFLIPMSLSEWPSFVMPTAVQWLHIFYLGILCSAAGYFLYIVSLEKLGSSRTTIFINLIPVVSLVASYFFLGERIRPWQMVGAVITIAGIYIATLKRDTVLKPETEAS